MADLRKLGECRYRRVEVEPGFYRHGHHADYVLEVHEREVLVSVEMLDYEPGFPKRIPSWIAKGYLRVAEYEAAQERERQEEVDRKAELEKHRAKQKALQKVNKAIVSYVATRSALPIPSWHRRLWAWCLRFVGLRRETLPKARVVKE